MSEQQEAVAKAIHDQGCAADLDHAERITHLDDWRPHAQAAIEALREGADKRVLAFLGWETYPEIIEGIIEVILGPSPSEMAEKLPPPQRCQTYTFVTVKECGCRPDV